MSCSRYSARLSWLLDGELSPREAEDVSRHVAQCVHCRLELEHWRRQGTHLRGYLKRHALSEEFVTRVVKAAAQREPSPVPVNSHGADRRILLRWLPVAAAVLIGIAILSLVTPFRGSIGYARVLGPGERLEVMNSRSNTWVRTIAGEILHPGDWLRNPAADSAVILWRDSCRLQLEPGTLAQIPENPFQPVDRLNMVRGSLTAEVKGKDRQFQVHTPSGDITVSAGGFSIHSGELLLPSLEVSDDGTETFHGTSTPIATLSVLTGRARVKSQAFDRDVPSGETIVFTRSVVMSTPPLLEPVDAFLKVQDSSSSASEFSTSLFDTGQGVHLESHVSGVRLNRFLEYATGCTVRGGEDLSVSGSLSALPGAGPQTIASRVGAALGLPVSFRQEKTRRFVASLPQEPLPQADSVQGDYVLEKTSDGFLNLSFHGIPAAKAFSVLRTAVQGLPELSAGSAASPIDLHASELKPDDAAAWIVKTLGLQVREGDYIENVIEVASPAPAPATAPSVKPSPAAVEKPRGDVNRQNDPPRGAIAQPVVRDPIPVVPDTQSAEALTPPGDMLTFNALNELPFEWSQSVFYPSGGLIRSTGSSTTGKLSSKSYEFLGGTTDGRRRPSTHLVWPPVGEADPGTLDYVLTNPMGLPAHAVWKGFDAQGTLVAEYEVVVGKSSTLLLNLQRDLPGVLDADGHWEMSSDLPLRGALHSGAEQGVGVEAPLGSEQLQTHWTLPAWWLTDFGGRFWLANPGPSSAEATLTLVLGDKVLSAERVIISSHGALIWPDLSSTMDFAAATGATVEIQAVRGVIAAGLAK